MADKQMQTGYSIMNNGEQVEDELYDDAAPKRVENFEKLANDHFYDGLSFHRVIPGFVSQGGCPKGHGTGDAGYTIKCETEGNPYKHDAGTLSMAHAGKDTGSCQFFSVHQPQPRLDGVPTVLGKVTSGLDIARQMQNGDAMETIVVNA